MAQFCIPLPQGVTQHGWVGPQCLWTMATVDRMQFCAWLGRPRRGEASETFPQVSIKNAPGDVSASTPAAWETTRLAQLSSDPAELRRGRLPWRQPQLGRWEGQVPTPGEVPFLRLPSTSWTESCPHAQAQGPQRGIWVPP